jgi:hypothetical protein
MGDGLAPHLVVACERFLRANGVRTRGLGELRHVTKFSGVAGGSAGLVRPGSVRVAVGAWRRWCGGELERDVQAPFGRAERGVMMQVRAEGAAASLQRT